jgi:tryptophanyl-tRNA synthetase
VENLFGLLRACGKQAEADALLQDYKAGNRQYSRLKGAVSDALVEFINPMRTRREELIKDRAAVLKTAKEMSARARETASETLREVRKRVGLPESH